MTKERKIKVKMGLQNLLQYIYRVVHVYSGLVLIIFQFFWVTCLYGSLLNSLYGS